MYWISILDTGKGLEVEQNPEQRLDIEIKNQFKRLSKADQETSEKVKDNKFQFTKKGRLTMEEEADLRRTNKNMFDWVKVVVPPLKTVDLVIEDDGQDEWMEELGRKEERLARMEMRRK